MKKIKFIGLLSLISFMSIANQKNITFADAQVALNRTNRFYFIENKGQWHSDVLYLCRMGGLDAWITKYGVNYTFYKIEHGHANKNHYDKFNSEELQNINLIGHRVLFELQHCNANPDKEGKLKQKGYYNYFIGNDDSKHTSNVGLYEEVIIKNIFDGIDIRYYFYEGYLRYDFVVHPGADPSRIKWTLKGHLSDDIKKDNKFVFTTRFGEIKMAELRTYQQGGNIQSRFVKQGNVFGISLDNYDKNKTLIIDPIVYSTFIGGNGIDNGTSIVIDVSGNAFITGSTYSSDYDITPGAFQTTLGGFIDVFVTKLNNIGTGLIYSTYIGGSNEDSSNAIAIDGGGNAYITGTTYSSNYDITSGAFQTNYGGGFTDVFVTKINSTGTGLVYSTFIGGDDDESGNSIALDGSGNAYITGRTWSSNYDITTGSFQTTNQGGNDVFVTKINSTGTGLLYSTYIGGNNSDIGYGIAIDGSGNAYITGSTNSTNYDITVGSFQTNYGGGFTDVFVTKINSTGTGLIYSTYLGGNNEDCGYAIAIDGTGNAYITGYTLSNDYDITSGVFQTNFGGGLSDVFVTKLNSTGGGLLYSTYIGGSNSDFGYDIAVDGSGNAYITGYTNSTDYDITSNANQTTKDVGDDVFVTKLNASCTGLLYSTYIGGNNNENGYDITIDLSGNAYITGYTNSTNYDITSGAYQTTNAFSDDVFVTKLTTGPTGIVNNTNFLTEWNIYPNPNQGQFSIQCLHHGEFELMDITGRIIREYSITSTPQIVNEKLPTGIYFIKEKGSNTILKFIVE